MDEQMNSDSELQELDNTSGPEDEGGNASQGAVGGADIVGEMSVDASGESEEMSSEPSTSGNIRRKRRSDSSYPVEKRASLGSWSFEQKDGLSDTEPDMESTSIQIYDTPSFEEIQRSLLLRDLNDNADIDINFGDVGSTCAGPISSKEYDPEEVLQRIPEPAQRLPSVITESHIEYCRQFGIYKCKCGKWFSTKTAYQEHKSSCNSDAPDATH